MPMVTLGDRNALLAFNATQIPTNKNIHPDFTLFDNKTGKYIQHMTYLVTIVSKNKTFHEKGSQSDGHLIMEFTPSTIEPYHINANFDTLSASYMADYGGPIRLGNIFTTGNYTVSLEVTGVDFDNLFLPTPLKFEIPVSISS